MRFDRNHAFVATDRLARVRVLGAVLLATTLVAQLGAAGIAQASTGQPPTGHLDFAVQEGMGVHLRGWAYDPDTTAPVKVRLTVDGSAAVVITASQDRPDVAAVYPAYGAARGFEAQWPLHPGTHQVCAYALDYPSNYPWLLRCHTVLITHNPAGGITSLVQRPGVLQVTGWALDPDDPAHSRTVAIQVDGKQVASGQADQDLPSMAAAHPLAGTLHAYALSFPIGEGTHLVCLKVTNVGAGTNTTVRCVSRTVTFSPSGAISTLVQVPGGVRLAGNASDPDTAAPIGVTITAGGTVLGTVTAADAAGTNPGHGFHARFLLPGSRLVAGARTICAIGRNAGTYGHDRTVQCISKSFNWNPSVFAVAVTQRSPGAHITGWASDPDTASPVNVRIVADGRAVATTLANRAGATHSGHWFAATVALPDGSHSVCAIAVNTLYGSANSGRRCATVRLAFEPYGASESIIRVPGSTDLRATGWTIDPDTTAPIPVAVSVDGGSPVTATAGASRPDIARAHPGTGTAHGYAVRLASSSAEHRVCVRAINVLGGSGTTALGCTIVNAVHPSPPGAPRTVTAIAGYGGARVVWAAPVTDGGAPWSGYRITASPGGRTMTVASGINSATVLGLTASTGYTFSVVAVNVAGASPAATSALVTTQRQPPAQTSPAPISTSRYIRNVTGSSAADLATMRAEGAVDAGHNPSGHGYLAVLAVGGQDESSNGVILSATITYVSYSDMVKNLDAYIDGYASQQRPSAPATVAIATNNDIDVWRGSGVNFADKVVDPVAAHAARYPGITIAGSSDMEPGFRAGFAASKAWLQGYLSATRAPFVFTGSADGCAWSVPNRGCNNGWTMSGLFYLAGGASAIRIINLPQVYNSTMAQQWRYISLTGVLSGQPKIDFGGALTEWTACNQDGSCGSLTGNSAWLQMWAQLRADPRLKPASLPYSTDLRIDS